MSRNAFLDLGFSEKDAGEMTLRIAIAVQIKNWIDAKGLKQEDAKVLFGVPQPTISKIKKLRLDGLSLSLLVRMLFKAGLPFRFSSQGSSETVSAILGENLGTAIVARDWKLQIAPKSPAADRIANLSEMPRANESGDFLSRWPVAAG